MACTYGKSPPPSYALLEALQLQQPLYNTKSAPIPTMTSGIQVRTNRLPDSQRLKPLTASIRFAPCPFLLNMMEQSDDVS